MAVRLAITAAILIYLAFQIDMRAAGLAVVRVHPGYLALVLALVACDRLVMILRWVLLLRASGVPIAARSAARIFLVSSFVGSFLPAGVGGDVARAYGLARATADSSEAVASVAIDRVLGIVALVVMGLVGLTSTANTLTDWRALAAAALLLAASIAIFWADRLVGAVLPSSWKHRWIGRHASATGDALSRYRTRPATLALVFWWSVVVQLLRIVQAYFLGLGLGLAVPFRVLSGLHAGGTAHAAPADLDQRVRATSRGHRLVDASAGGSRRGILRLVDPHRAHRPGWQSPWSGALVAADKGNRRTGKTGLDWYCVGSGRELRQARNPVES